MRKTLLSSLMLILTAGTLLAGCGTEKAGPSASEDHKIVIYTTVYPYYDFAQKIGGDLATVENLVPPGVEPHDFEPSAKDMVKLSQANLFIYNGAGYEGWVDKALQAAQNSEMMVLEAADKVELLELEHEEHATEDKHAAEEDKHAAEEDEHAHGTETGAVDPHIWLNPLHAQKIAESIKNALVQLDPNHTKSYEDNYAALVSQFDQLDQDFKDLAEHAGRKEMIVSHSAFGYLAEAYGLEQIAIAGISPSDEPTQKELQHIIEQAQQHETRYILFETLVSGKVAEVVKHEVGAEALTLNPLENLTEAEIAKDKDYFTVMKENLETLKKVLEYDKK